MPDATTGAVALVNARILDGTGAPIVEDAGIVLKSGKIHGVGPV